MIQERSSPRIVLLFAGVFAATMAACREGRPRLPPMLFQLPPFQLVSHRGQPFGTAQLAGKVWIANFIFTSCPSICPKLTREMAKVQSLVEELGDEVHLVSFSVDPQNDTPEKLAAYAARHGAGPRWSFLTGPLDRVEEAVKKGFKLAMDRQVIRVKEGRAERELFDITHGTRMVLLDRGAGIRGYYEANDAGIARLVADARLLVRHTR